MNYQAIFGKVGDLFSVHNPVSHWWYQRVTAVAMVPLSFWVIVFLSRALSAPYAETIAWISSPLNGACILAWLLAVIYHSALGVQVVLEDYVSTLSVRNMAIRITNGLFLALGLAAVIAILIIWMR